jgi:hypothetical protein
MSHLYDLSADGTSPAEPTEPSVVTLESRRSRRARAEAAIAALKEEFLHPREVDSSGAQTPVITHVIFSDEDGPARRQRQFPQELPEPQAVEPPDMPA